VRACVILYGDRSQAYTQILYEIFHEQLHIVWWRCEACW